jgi:hypothetical protein
VAEGARAANEHARRVVERGQVRFPAGVLRVRADDQRGVGSVAKSAHEVVEQCPNPLNGLFDAPADPIPVRHG